MECYLKNLLDEKAESNSAEVRIIDDNFNNSSLSSLTDPGKLGNSRSSSRWADSSNSMDFEESATCLDNQDSDTSSYMSARMERHRRNRWNATANSSVSSRHSLSPGVLRNRKRRSVVPNSTKTLHSSLELDTPSLAGRQRHRKPIKQTRDYNDDHAIHNNTRMSPTSLSARLFDIDVSLSHRMVIDEAIAISTDESVGINSETSMRRAMRGDSSKNESKCAPPSAPVRRRSIEHNSYDSTHMDVEEDRKLDIPPPPARKVSLDSFDSIHSTDFKKPNLEIPSLIRDLPHRQHNRRRKCRKHPSM